MRGGEKAVSEDRGTKPGNARSHSDEGEAVMLCHRITDPDDEKLEGVPVRWLRPDQQRVC